MLAVRRILAVFYAFFALAAQSPTRQKTFRRVVVVHLLVLSALVFGLFAQAVAPPAASRTLLGQILLVAGIVEGALLIGWRLTQMPKSQALEFLLVSPLRPHWLVVAEVLVGLAQLALVTMSGLPVFMLLEVEGYLAPLDPVVLLVLPLTWGAFTGVGLMLWAYEPLAIRRWGERITMLFILMYLLIGVLAGENLRQWLGFLPEQVSTFFLRSFAYFHTHNPFGVMSHFLENDYRVAWQRAAGLEAATLAIVVLLLWRAARRLQGHFHELHYLPARNVANQKRPRIADSPLSWWAVKRVSRYSGRINLWLAGGFGILYALYTVAGSYWPPWLGKQVFQMCDWAGGIAVLTTGLVLLAAVPASFQYGLWDSNAQDRCRRLELLLLTDLQPRDYWNAAAAAAWKRGRGYFAVALLLWLAAAIASQAQVGQLIVAIGVAVLLWGFYFTLGFRAFSRGTEANGLGMGLTVGLPLLAYAFYRLGCPFLGSLLPPGEVYSAGSSGPSVAWLGGPLAVGGAALLTARRSLLQCDAELRRWYDRHHGSRVAG
jgi:hypothetical protein